MAQVPPSNPSQEVLVLQFSDRVPPAGVFAFLNAHSHSYHLLRVDEPFDAALYASSPWRAVVVLGGPQGAYEEALHPYLVPVKRLLAQQLTRNAPILGICLGCQLLAEVVGGSVFKSPQPELGYVAMTPSDVGESDPLISALLPFATRGLYLNHHGDSFTLPPHVPVLLSSATHPQAFRYRAAVAVQFHPEAGLEEYRVWLKGDSEERMRLVGRSKEELIEEAEGKADEAAIATRDFFRVWWREVEAKEKVATPLTQSTIAGEAGLQSSG